MRAAVAWRWRAAKRSWFLFRHYRNGGQLIRALRGGAPCDQAILRDGTPLQHPGGKDGFISTLLEIWYEQAYTPPGFYTPRPGDVVVDAGANVGLFAIWIARRNPRCRVVALEPFPENYACLTENLRSAACPSVTAYPIALGGRSGESVIVSGGRRSLDHRIVPGAGAEEGSAVRIVSLKDLLHLVHSDKIALLKIDIEGSEYDVFEGMEAGAVDGVERMAIEYHEHLRPGVLALLRDRLGASHDLQIESEPLGRYGMILARRK